MKDPKDVVKAGDIVKVKVVEVDIARKRIALTMKLNEPIPAAQKQPFSSIISPKNAKLSGSRGEPPAASSAMASAFAKLKK